MDNDQTIDNLKITKKKRESGQLERPAEPAGKFTREVKLGDVRDFYGALASHLTTSHLYISN